MGTYDRPEQNLRDGRSVPGTAAVLYERADRNAHRRPDSSDGGGIWATFKDARRGFAG